MQVQSIPSSSTLTCCKSVINPSLEFKTNEAVISLFRLNMHAELSIESIKNGKLCLQIVHLTGTGISREWPSCMGVGLAKGHFYVGTCANPCHSEGEIEIKEITTPWKVPEKISGNAQSWIVSKEKATLLIQEAEKKRNDEKNPVHFTIFGHHNMFDRVKQLCGYSPGYNCISFALDVLRVAGIHINPKGGNINFWTAPWIYTKDPLEAHPLEISDFCMFAKEGQVDAIRANFSPRIGAGLYLDVDTLTSGASFGPVESYLGTYNPLALAIAYGHLKTVKLLVEEYGASTDILFGRRKDITAVDCARHDFWHASVDPKIKAEILSYLIQKESACFSL